MEGSAPILFQYGLAGVVILAQSGVIVALYKELREERKGKIDQMEARRIDAVEGREQVTSVLPGITQSLQNIYDKIEISKGRR